MREIKIGDKIIRVRASALAQLYYRQEFKSDLLKDFLGLQNLIKGTTGEEFNPEAFNYMFFMQMIWAMAKADQYPVPFPSFEAWLNDLGVIDLSDVSFIIAAVEEAADGFFRR